MVELKSSEMEGSRESFWNSATEDEIRPALKHRSRPVKTPDAFAGVANSLLRV